MKNDFQVIWMIKLLLILYLSFASLLLSIQAQEVYSDHFDIKDGLPGSEFYDVYIDGKGYVWFASDHGMVRYNGYEFEIFSLSHGLSNMVNFNIHTDTLNTFWVNGFDGSFSFWNGDRFIPFKFNSKLKKLAFENSTYFEITATDKNSIHFIRGSNSKPIGYVIDRITGVLDTVSLKNLSVSANCSSKTKRSIRWLRYLSGNPINGTVDFKSHSSLFAWNNSEVEKGKRLPYVYNEFLGGNNELFLMSGQNFSIYPNADLSQDPLKLLSGNEITSAMEGPNGGIWATSKSSGLYFIPSMDIRIVLNENNNNSFEALFAMGDFLYAKNSNGVIKKINKKFEFLPKDYPANRSLNNGYIDPFKPGEFNFAGTIFQSVDHVEDSPMNFDSNVFSLEQNLSLKYNSTSFRFLLEDGNNSEILTNTKVRTFCGEKDKFGNIYIGTLQGLVYVNKESLDAHTPEIEWVPELLEIRINDIAITDEGVWLATLGNGLIFWTGNSLLTPIEFSNISPSIHTLNSQNDSLLWVGTNQGLYKICYKISQDEFDVSSIQAIGANQGLSSNYIKDVLLWEDNIWLATDKGVCYFNPKIFQNKATEPRVHLEKFIVNGSSIFDFTNFPVFSHRQNDIQILYTGISSNKPINNNSFYRYYLSTQDPNLPQTIDWVYTNNRNALLYNLPADNYNFGVQCRDLNNNWSTIATTRFKIQPHFTHTIWFKILLLLILIAIVSLIWFLRSNILKNRISLELRLKTAELKTLRNQMNPHFIFNSLNAIQNYIFKGNPNEANLYIHTFSVLIRKSLQFSRVEKITLKEEINFIREYLMLEKMRFEEKFDYKVELIEHDLNEMIVIPALLIQPIVENSVKHAFKNFRGKGNVYVSYTISGNSKFVIVLISDNGIGINNSAKKNRPGHQSLGLQIIKQRLELINEQLGQPIGKLNILKNNSKGTIVEVKLPIL